MAREGRSHVRKTKKRLSGWLPDQSAARCSAWRRCVFVGAHVLGFVKSDPQTGAPTLQL